MNNLLNTCKANLRNMLAEGLYKLQFDLCVIFATQVFHENYLEKLLSFFNECIVEMEKQSTFRFKYVD